MRKVLFVALAMLVASACVPPPEDIDKVPDFDADDAYAGEVQERGVLRIGFPEEGFPPFAITESRLAGDPGKGFVLDLAQEIAAGLDVEVETVHVEGDPLESVGDVDIMFAPIPTTEALARKHQLSHPYWIAHQRLLVPSGGSEPGAGDTVCTVLDDVTSVAPSELYGDVEEVPSDVDGCARMLAAGEADAIAAPDVDLMSAWARLTECAQPPCSPSADYEIVGDQQTTAGYGAILPFGRGWKNFVDSTWAETDFEGDWLRFYEEWIAPYDIEVDSAPEMRLEEAAGLFPS